MKFLVVVLCLAAASEGRLDFYEGDICKEQNGSKWTCKKLSQCPKARNLKNSGKKPQLCKPNKGISEDVVCCEPQEVKTSPVGLKSKEKCKEYAKAVYAEEPDGFGEGVLLRDTCAVPEPLITEGENASPSEFPHMALIGYGKKSSIQWLCGGSLISEQFVLSAAHCTDTGSRGVAKWVRLGEYNLGSTEDDDRGLAQHEDYEIIQRINYPLYNSSSDYHDIALYKLSRKVEFNEFIRPLCLQTEHQFPKTTVIATGWGRKVWGGPSADILQKVNFTITPRKDCSNFYRGTLAARLKDGVKDDIMFCAGDTKTRKDTCQSDSGGPLQIALNDPYCMYTQVGVTSFGFKCGSNKPGGYTRVSGYVSWIEKEVWP